MSGTLTFAEALIAAGSGAEFAHGGFLYPKGVPADVVRAYAAARLARASAEALLAQMVAAFMGGAAAPDDDGRSFVWQCARAWAARCGELERQVRRLATPSVASAASLAGGGTAPAERGL